MHACNHVQMHAHVNAYVHRVHTHIVKPLLFTQSTPPRLRHACVMILVPTLHTSGIS